MSKATKRVTELPSYGLELPTYTPETIAKIENNLINHWVEKTNKEIMEFFYPYLRKTGIKGQITIGKTNWRGIKIRVKSCVFYNVYQLEQRGVLISPEFKVDFLQKLRSTNIK